MSKNVDLRELAIERGGSSLPSLRHKRHVLTRYALPLILVLGFLGLVMWASFEFVFPPHAVTVIPVLSTTAEFRRAGTPLFKAAGWIEPRPTPVRVAALAPGVVEKLFVVEDQPVKEGESIAQLVDRDARLTLDAAHADLELRQAELDEVKAHLAAAETRFEQPVHLEAALGEAEAFLATIQTLLRNLPFEIRRAESDHKAMRKDYEGKLAAEGVVAGIAIDIAESKSDAARALVEELRNRTASLEYEKTALSQRRDALKTQLRLLIDETKARDEAQAQIKAANARVDQARVAVAEAELQFDRMTIVAPIDGRVFRLIAHPGARIGGGMTQMEGHDGSTVVTLYRPEMLQVRVDTRFEDIPKISLNQPVRIENPALSSPLLGKVLFISSEADIQKNTLEVKVAIADPPPMFKPEMLVDVTFLAPQQAAQAAEMIQETRLYVLQQLIHRDGDGSFVWLADQSEGIAKKMAIESGPVLSNGLVEVTKGLSISSRIISTGSDGLRDGDRVRVTHEDTSLGTNANLGVNPPPLN